MKRAVDADDPVVFERDLARFVGLDRPSSKALGSEEEKI